MTAKGVARDCRFNFGAQFAVAYKRQVQGWDCFHRNGHSLNQQGDSFLPRHPADGNQPGAGCWQGCELIELFGFYAAMHDVQFWPISGRRPARQLAAPKAGNGHHKGSARDFQIKAQGHGCVEFFGAMGGKAESRAAQDVGQHRHCGGVCAKMGVNVGDASVSSKPCQTGSFDQINQVSQPPARAGHATRTPLAALHG